MLPVHLASMSEPIYLQASKCCVWHSSTHPIHQCLALYRPFHSLSLQQDSFWKPGTGLSLLLLPLPGPSRLPLRVEAPLGSSEPLPRAVLSVAALPRPVFLALLNMHFLSLLAFIPAWALLGGQS